MKKIYIAGKITGLKDGEAYRNFRLAEQRIRESGHYPINPMKLDWMYPGFSYEEFMTVDRALIDISDSVLFLDNWVDSPGAHRELDYATALGKEIYTERWFYGLGESNEGEALKRAGGGK